MKNRDIVKSIARASGRNNHSNAPYTVSIYKLCDNAGKLDCFNQIRNRIFRELEEDEQMAGYVAISVEDFGDIYLSDEGVFMFSEILMGYFEKETIIDLWKYIRELNRRKKSAEDLQSEIHKLTTKSLKRLKADTQGVITVDEEAKELLAAAIDREIKKRRYSFLPWSKIKA